jgi:hypothetical protein
MLRCGESDAMRKLELRASHATMVRVALPNGVQGHDKKMVRTIMVACIALSAAQALAGEEVCVVCEKPQATYRCTFDQTSHDSRLVLGDAASEHVCENVLEKAGPHASCKTIKSAEPCNGVPRTVTVADYQRYVASDGHSTYQQGFLEKAQKCLSSFFGDC